ncbi:SGNH/GDSL hydrolase family protein [Parafannyhessea umbonata]|uniref:Lysophospholipase L1 n=1 Tax=Parafannyhessea umbonata TaxID=604330 RepID=A0A1H1KW77_9ACTN|nr:SGNH/GDSL hydrolase family protein [Parafannyhessea umbonata]SDR66397.1 Lysophospholipase L1 [Parafannyhessea umbonata]
MAKHMSTNDRQGTRRAQAQAPANGEKDAAPGAQAAPQAEGPHGGAAYGQRPVERTLVTLLVAAVACVAIVALGELGILHYPEKPEPAPAKPAAAASSAKGSPGRKSQDSGTSAADASTSDASDPSSSAAAPSPVVSTKLAEMFAKGEVKSIRVLGDSITAGLGCDGYDAPSDTGTVVYSGPQGSYQESATTVSTWANDFRAYAAQRGVTNFVNAGISGFKMQYLAEDPAAWLGDGADVIVVMLGTNDAARRTSDEFCADAEIGLKAAAAKCKLLIVVSPPQNRRTDATNNFDMQRADQILTSLCKMKGYVHVSFLDTLQLDSEDFNADELHPTTAGSHKLWQAFKTQLGLV